MNILTTHVQVDKIEFMRGTANHHIKDRLAHDIAKQLSEKLILPSPESLPTEYSVDDPYSKSVMYSITINWEQLP